MFSQKIEKIYINNILNNFELSQNFTGILSRYEGKDTISFPGMKSENHSISHLLILLIFIFKKI